jgi:hypothetical protein
MPRRRVDAAPSLRIKDFLALVHEGVEARIGSSLGGMSQRQRFGYVQYYRDDPSVHFEVWAQRRTGRVEIGLHFESSDRDRNYAAATALAAFSIQVADRVGPEYELEEWTRVWTRLHRSFEAPSLTPELADDAAGRVVALIRGMEPLLEQLDLVPARA